MTATKTDITLIEEYKSTQNTDVIGELYLRYSHLVFGSCLNYLKQEQAAEDAAVEIFEKLHKDLLRFNIQYFKSWLFTYTKNHCLMKLRKKSGEVSMHEIQIADDSLMENSHEKHLKIEKENQLENLEKALQSLNEEQQKCVKLFYLDEKSYQEIVDETGFEMKKVKSYIQNGKRNMKLFMMKNLVLFIIMLILIDLLL